MATYRIEDYKKAGLPQEAERRMARIVELSSGLGYGAAEDRRNHKQFLEMIYKIKFDPKMETFTTPNAARSTNSIVAKALNAAGEGKDYYVVDEFGNVADGSKTPLPFDRASALFLKLTGSKSGNGKWGIIRKGEPASKARDWYGNIVSWNAATSTVREKAVNAKFKVGDKVKYVGSKHGAPYGKVLTIVKEPDNLGRYTIHWDSDHSGFMAVGSDGFAYEDELVLANARACNADFNVGDRVRIKNPNRQIGQDDGTYEVTLIRPDGMISIKAPSEKVGFAVRPEQLIANAARNDALGRYKPGARVAVELRTRPIVGKVMQYGGRPEVEYSPTTRTRFTGTLIKQNGDKWDIKSDSGEVYKSVSEADFGLSYNSRSRNAVVQKALNAQRARNNEQFHTYLVPVLRKGVKDYVTIERVADEETAKELVDVPSFRIIGVTVDETRPVKVAKNATALNYSPYRKGAWLHDDKGREYTVVEEEHWGKDGGAERFVTIRDEQTKQTREVPVTELAHRFDFGEAKNAAMAQNAVAMNWNFKNSYQFFCVDPSLKVPCILSGWDYREDAKDDAAELKEAGIPHKIVSRRFLEQQGIDPNAESSWKKNRQ